MNSSLSWNDVVNPVFWLATRANRMILPSRTCPVTVAVDTDMGYWPRPLFFFTRKIDRNERKKGTWPITIFISHFRNTHIYREHLSYVAKLAVLLGRGNGRDRARQTTPSAEQANRDSIPVRQWVRQCAGQISSTSQNPFTNHDLPGFFAYPARHRRE